MSGTPPRAARWLLERLLDPADREFILADLDLEFEAWVSECGAEGAKRRYWGDLLRSVIPSIGSRLRQGRRRPSSPRNENIMSGFFRDLRFAGRMFRKQPVFTAVAVLTLAVGIGANTAIFSVLQGTLLAPLPFENESQLMSLTVQWTESGSGRRSSVGHSLSEPELMDFRERVPAFEGIAAYTSAPVNITGEGDPERIEAGVVTANTFEILGVQALHGRTFVAEEGQVGGTSVVILSRDFWTRRYAADPSIVGRDIIINGSAFTVVGVAPAGFALPHTMGQTTRHQLWVPLELDPQNLSGRGSHYLYTVARLGQGSTVEQANSQLSAVGQALTDEGHYQPEAQFGAAVLPIRELVLGPVRPVLFVLFGAVGFVLLIACANVANLLLARSEARRRELAVRLAVGAGRGQLVRQLLAESTLLALVGGGLGVGLAAIGTKLLIAFEPGSVPRLADVSLNGGVLGYALALSLGTGMLFGTAPALLSSKADVQSALKDGPRTGRGRAGHKFQHMLVAAQMGFAVLLVIGATLTIRSFANLRRIDTGFSAERVLSFRLALPANRYDTSEKMIDFYEQLATDVRNLPGVEAAGAVRRLPLAQFLGDWSISIEGRERQPGEDFDGDWQIVTAGYLETMRIPLLEGRTFDERDHADTPAAMVVNQSMAERYWPGESAIGKRVQLGTAGGRPWITIVGVVGDIRHNGISGPINAKWYVPHSQFEAAGAMTPDDMNIVLRATGDPLPILARARQLVTDRDSSLPVAEVQTLEEVLHASVASERFAMTLLLAFGVVALFLAAVGVYGVLSFSVSQRTHEIGLRMALGATRVGVTALVVRQGMIVALAGLAGGTIAALWLTDPLSSLLYEVGTRDVITFAVVPVFLAVIAFVASLLPARRAVRVDPMLALREE